MTTGASGPVQRLVRAPLGARFVVWHGSDVMVEFGAGHEAAVIAHLRAELRAWETEIALERQRQIDAARALAQKGILPWDAVPGQYEIAKAYDNEQHEIDVMAHGAEKPSRAELRAWGDAAPVTAEVTVYPRILGLVDAESFEAQTGSLDYDEIIKEPVHDTEPPEPANRADSSLELFSIATNPK